MVGKLNDMVAAAVVADSATKIGGAAPQVGTPAAPQIIKTPGTDIFRQQEEKEQEKEARLEPGTMSEESVNEMTDTFNQLMDKINCNLEFKYNKEVDMFNVKMIDKETKEVIKEFPPEEMIENMIKAKDWLGAFIDRAI